MMRGALPLPCALLGALLGAAGAHAADLPIAGGARFDVPVKSMRELRFTSTTRQQYDFSCGSAALATLLTYHYGYPVSETVAFKAMWDSGDQAKCPPMCFETVDYLCHVVETHSASQPEQLGPPLQRYRLSEQRVRRTGSGRQM